MDLHLDHMDLQTRSLAIAILRQDIKEAVTEMNPEGKSQFDYDSKVALDIYLADLEAQPVVASDRIMAQSIVQAVHHDGTVIAAALSQEKQADSDRKAALQLHEKGHLPQPPKPLKPDENTGIDDERRSQLEAEYNLRPQDDNEDDDHIYPRRLAKIRPCLICDEKVQFNDLARLPCSHEYCRGCLKDLFTLCLTDETLYPPRCCKQRIPETETQIRLFLGGKLLGRFLARKLELDTPNRTYCHKADCSKFIPPQGIRGDTGTCPKCESRTCCICKGAAHQGSDCPKDESTQQLLTLASEKGWKACYQCRRMVELKYGCNHISCRCGAQFCYVCGGPWMTAGQRACDCPIYDEEQLMRQARQEAAAQNPGFHQQAPARQAQIVQQQREHIVQNHACQHEKWWFGRGHFKCHECSEKMHRYIFFCRQCDFRACYRCKINRL